MDLEEEQTLIKPAQPAKPVRKVKYTKKQNCTLLTLLLCIMIILLGIVISIDIAGYVELKLYIKTPTQKTQLNQTILEKMPEEQKVQYDDTHDEIQDDEYNQKEVNPTEITPTVQVTTPVVESGSFEYIDEAAEYDNSQQEVKEIEEVDELAGNEQQLQQLTLLQAGVTQIIKPIIDKNNYEYLELPNNLKVLFVSGDDNEILMNVNQGYWDTKYYLKCDCEVQFTETQTIYTLKSSHKDFNTNLNKFSQIFIEEQPQLKQILHQSSGFERLLSLLADKKHPFSRDYKNIKQFQYSANQMTLVIKTNQDIDKLKEFLIQSDFVLIKDFNLQKNYPNLFAQLGVAIKWNNDQDYNSIKLIYQLPKKNNQQSSNIRFIDYFVQGSLKNYILQKNYGLDVKTTTLMDQSNNILYQVQIDLPLDDDFEFDQRELAYRLSKIFATFMNQLSDKLNGDYFKEMSEQFNAINNIKFNYQTNNQNLANIANHINLGFISDAISLNVLSDINKKQLKQQMKQLQNSNNLIIIVNDQKYIYTSTKSSFIQAIKGSSTSDLLYLTKNELELQDDDITYSIRKLNEQTLKFIQTFDETVQFDFPQHNKYIPQQLHLIDSSSSELKTIDNNFYWQSDIKHKIPAIYFGISLDSYNQNVYGQYIYEKLTNHFDQALQAGYQIDVTTINKLTIQLSGWSDQFEQFFQNVIDLITEKQDQKQMQLIQAKFDSLPIHVKFLQTELQSILVPSLRDTNSNGIKNIHFTTLLYGNIDEKQSVSIKQYLDKNIKNIKNQNPQLPEVINLTGQNIKYRIETDDKWQVLVQYYQFGKRTLKNAALFEVAFAYLQQQLQKDSSSHLLIQQKPITCVDGFVVIKQTFKNLDQENKDTKDIINNLLEQFNKIDSKTLKQIQSQLHKDNNYNLFDEGRAILDQIDSSISRINVQNQIQKLKLKDVKNGTKQKIGMMSFYIQTKNSGNGETNDKDLEKLNLSYIQCN